MHNGVRRMWPCLPDGGVGVEGEEGTHGMGRRGQHVRHGGTAVAAAASEFPFHFFRNRPREAKAATEGQEHQYPAEMTLDIPI